MAFVNLSLLIGGLLVAVPIVLHLMMRQQPRQLVFPAIRFVKQRRETNRRQLQLRHWLLLLLRCLAIAALAAALARPSVASAAVGNWMVIGLLAALLLVVLLLAAAAVVQNRGRWLVGGLAALAVLLLLTTGVLLAGALSGSSSVLLGDQQAPVAAVLVVDSSPRMQYRHRNQTRLEQAQETALWVMGQLPEDSEVAVLQSRPGPAVFSVDLAAAHKAVERLQPTGVPRPLVQVLEDALQLARTSEQARKEIYIFTDLTEASWQADSTASLKRRLDEAEDVLLYVIDVGVEHPHNFALGELQLSGQTLPGNAQLHVQTEVSHVGPGGTRTVELYLEQNDPTRPVIRDGKMLLPPAQRRSRQVVELGPDGSQKVEFRVRPGEPGVYQGYVKIAGQDGLAIDDVRYFTVEVKRAWPLLVVAPENAVSSFLVEALAPYEFRMTGQARFACEVITPAELANQSLESYAAVCLLDPPPLTPPQWEKLAGYVHQGGGLALFLGHNAQPTASYNEPAAQQLLPGKLTRQWRSGGRNLYLAPHSLDHPVLAAFRPLATSVPWQRFPVLRHWGLDELDPQARVVLPYGNNQPALVDKPWGQGRVLTMTTPVSDPLRPGGRQPWNELPTGEDPWPYFILVNEMLGYLSESGDYKLNYRAGEMAVLANHPDRHPDRYQLFVPQGNPADMIEPQDITASDGRLTVKFTETPGTYRLKGHRGTPVSRGFAVNLPADASRLTRISRQQLDDLLGDRRYQFARDRNEIEVGVGTARVGREFYPLLIVLLAMLLGLEHTLANRFYRKSEAGPVP